jgi:hypothetical protein
MVADPRTVLARRLLPSLAAGTLSPFWTTTARRWVAASPELSAEYEALRRAEHVASGHSQPLSAAQRDVVRAMLFASLDASLDAPGADHAHTTSHAASHRPALVSGIAGALACASLALFVVVAPDVSVEDDLRARGAKIEKDAVGVKVTCLAADGSRVLDSATAGARQSGARLSCTHGALLAFATTNLGAEERHIFVVGIGPGGEPRWYAPFGKDGAAQRAQPGEVDVVLPLLADTRTMPADDAVTLHVLVSDEAIDGESLARQLARATLPLDKLDRLPVDVPVQARIDVSFGAVAP